MAVENLKTTAITNLDGNPAMQNTSGVGAPAPFKSVDGYVTISAAASVTSTYKMVRVPSQAVIKAIVLESEAQGAGAVNVSAYYSDSTVDGTASANQGLIVPTTGDQFFASDVSLASAINPPTNVTNESGNYTLDKRQLQLWNALGLAADPGGYFDIVLVVHTTAITTGGGKTGLRVEYTA